MTNRSIFCPEALRVEVPGHPPIVAPARARVVVTGASGSGKSQFCLLLAGVADDDGQESHIRLFGKPLDTITSEERARCIGLVPSDPFLAFTGLKGSLRGELEMIQRLVAAGEPDQTFLEHVASRLELSDHLSRDPFTLSGGEAVRAAIAMALVKRPVLLVLDQVHEPLDSVATRAIQDRVVELLPRASLIFETRSRAADKRSAALVANATTGGARPWRVDVQPFDGNHSAPDSLQPAALPAIGQEDHAEGTVHPVLRIEGLEFGYSSSGFCLGPLDLSIASGECVALVGPNGSGKSTLLKCLALLQRPSFSRMEILAADGHAETPPPERLAHRWAGHALYCFQRPEDQLYLSSVREELAETSRRLGGPGSFDVALTIARDFGLEPHLDRSPYDLSRSLRRLIPLASALAVNPPLLLLDEPTVALDDAQVAQLIDHVVKRVAARATIFISHDESFVSAAATRTIDIRKFRPSPGATLET